MFGDIGDYVGATFKEFGKHPLQAMGAALGVPGYDPFFGGLFNNHKGGALLSPTGNFSSSAWDEMKGDNPDNQAGLNLFHKVNGVADIVAPAIAGAYGAGAAGLGSSFGGEGAGLGTGVGTDATAGASGITGGANGFTGMFSGPAAYGDSGLTSTVSSGGSGLSGVTAGDMGGALGDAPTGLFSGLLPGGGMTGTESGALGGGISGDVAGAAPIGGASMGGFNLSGLLNNQGNMPQGGGQKQPGQSGDVWAGGHGSPHYGQGTMTQLAQLYGLPAGLLATNLV